METLLGLYHGLTIALLPTNLLYCLVGALIGTLIGVLPGLGPVATVAMLLPVTLYLPPVTALIMLSGIYYGAQYGGSTTAILVNLPGENSSVVTCLDGYQMARQGRAGPALAVAALGSLFAGCVATLFIAFFAPPLAVLALLFGPSEYFALMVLGLIAAIVLAQGSLLKALGMIVLGLLLASVGTDLNSSLGRMTFGIPELADGIGFVPLAMGVFAVGEIIKNLEKPEERSLVTGDISNLWPTKDDFRRSWPAVLRGTALGSVLGLLPGGGAMLSSFAAYALEKRLSREPERFGRGAIEGVAAPESANNAGAQTSFIPLLTLGIPANAVIALMAGAMMIHGIQPGPQVLTKNPELFWGVVASMLIGNVMLVIINLPLIRIWVALLKIPYHLLYPAILVFCCIGVYSINKSVFEVSLLLVFGLMGYLFLKLRLEPAPLLLAFVLGPLMEENLRRAMVLSHGDPTVFATRPISAGLLLLALALLALVTLPIFRRTRDVAFKEEG
ncbi:tripartite tricarboxylate transporter permease [Bosea caraganae]|uniref:Tripartite tricarboxylate transporter permease n=1 Tax=Bosea caraganae TaxID=2763117 RepID=A0A370KXR8_9HYPH|nr:tripartite tricarboxylate transporter permease [Bosea caraganae]RDJ19771.1 tripartite tricarboxylate transporter permease [Bosea caraganae]RDJ21126.1 tripartite tricarboxylate transporter permease [Bosea caraganae]